MANLSKPPVKPQVFVDANVLIRGATFPRFPYEVLHHAARGDLTLVLSPTVLDEASRCLQELFPSEIWRFQALLDRLPIRLAPDPSPAEVAMHQDLVRDLRDVPIILAAARAGVDYLVSTDLDLTAEGETTQKLRDWMSPARDEGWSLLARGHGLG